MTQHLVSAIKSVIKTSRALSWHNKLSTKPLAHTFLFSYVVRTTQHGEREKNKTKRPSIKHGTPHLHVLDVRLQGPAALHWPALVQRPRANLAPARPALEVLCALLLRHLPTELCHSDSSRSATHWCIRHHSHECLHDTNCPPNRGQHTPTPPTPRSDHGDGNRSFVCHAVNSQHPTGAQSNRHQRTADVSGNNKHETKTKNSRGHTAIINLLRKLRRVYPT